MWEEKKSERGEEASCEVILDLKPLAKAEALQRHEKNVLSNFLAKGLTHYSVLYLYAFFVNYIILHCSLLNLPFLILKTNSTF